jgi:uncharacterized protein YjdB
VALAALLSSCGNLPTTSEGVAFLQVQLPSSTTLAVGATLQMHATALDQAGNPLDVAIRWRTPDTTLSVEAGTGLVTGLAPGTGRVQAVVGDEELVSDFITLTVQEPSAAPRRP